MKTAKYGGLPVPMPSPPAGMGDLYRFGSDVIKALKAIRDRPVIIGSNPKSFAGGLTPWKVTANGDEFVNVAAGKIIGQRWSESGGSFTGYPSYGEALSYAGGQVEVTASSGYIWAVMEANEVLAGTDFIAVYPSSLTVEFAVDETSFGIGTQMVVPVAQVSLTGGVASVDDQILYNNPILWHGFQSP